MRISPFWILPLALLLPGGPCPGQLAPQDLFHLTSPDFGEGGKLPKKLSKEDENASPTLDIAGTPRGAQSLVLIMDDPDAPGGTFTHWLVWDIPPGDRELVGNTAPPGTIGKNNLGQASYSGPNPPTGEHRYYFRLFALDRRLGLPAGSTRAAVEAAMRGHILASATLMGKYAKTPSFQ